MARSHYSYEKRQLEIKKKKKREAKLQKKQEKGSGPTDDAAEYLAMLRGESLDSESDDEEDDTDDGEDPEAS